MFQSVTDFWWPKPPTPPANTEISAPNYGFVLFQQYFNDAIDPAQSTPIIITTVVIAILVLFLMYRVIKKSSKINIESQKETQLLKANKITCNHFNDSKESTLDPKTIYPCLSSCTDYTKSVQFMVPPYTFAENTTTREFHHFQNQQFTPPERYSEGKDVENWLLKLKTYLQANPHLNKELTLKCLLDDNALALVELVGTQGKSFEDLTKIVKRLFKEKSHSSENVAKEAFYKRIQLPNESYLKYRIELTKLANEAFSKTIIPSAISKTIRIQFINGLRNHKISDACRMDLTEDFDVLIEKIECMEEALTQYTEYPSVLGDPQSKRSHNHNSNSESKTQTNYNYNNNNDFTPNRNQIESNSNFNKNHFDYKNNQNGNSQSYQSNNRYNRENNYGNNQVRFANNNNNQPNKFTNDATQSTQATVNQYQKNSLLSMNQPSINATVPSLPQSSSSSLTNSSTISNTVLSNPSTSSTALNTNTKQTFMLSQNLNETRIVGKCEINDEPVKFLVDTGSDNTTISQKTADRCGLTVDSEPVKRLIADGSETNINKVNTRVTFNDKPVVLDVNVLQSLPVDCLLGMDFISRHPATADLYQKLKDTFYKQAEREEEQPKIQYRKFKLKPFPNMRQIERQNVLFDLIKRRKLNKMYASFYNAVSDPIQEEKQATYNEIPIDIRSTIEKIDKDLTWTEQELGKIENFLIDYAKITEAKSYNELTPTTVVTHEIKLTDYTPIRLPIRPVPQAKQAAFLRKVQSLWDAGLIVKSNSPYRHPVHFIQKDANDEGRLVHDFRHLNKVTIKDAYPLPNTKEILTKISGKKWKSKMDLIGAYFNVRMHRDSEYLTAWSCSLGHFNYKVLPMGLTNATSSFQKLINHVFADYLFDFLNGYLDDLIVASDTLQNHVPEVMMVLKRLEAYSLKVKLSKCAFVKLEIQFLGHIVTHGMIKPMPSKLEKLKAFKVPNKISVVQAFVGLANYYKPMAEKFSIIAAPLYKCIGEPKFSWNEKRQEAFEKIKAIVTADSFLIAPDWDKLFIVDTDACLEGIGGCLNQDFDGKDKPVDIYSKHLTPTEQRYSTYERELMAMVKSIIHFKYYVYGREFLVRVDHQPLVYLHTQTNLTPRAQKWYMEVQGYSFKIIYRRGQNHTNADAISRLTLPEHNDAAENITNENHNCILLIQFAHESDQSSDPNIQWAIGLIKTHGEAKPCLNHKDLDKLQIKYLNVYDNLVIRDDKLFFQDIGIHGQFVYKFCVPQNQIKPVIEELHVSPYSGHLGRDKTLARVQERFFWPFRKVTVEEFVRACLKCAKYKRSPKNTHPMKIIIPTRPNELVSIDVKGPLPVTKAGNRYQIVFTDRFTKLVKYYNKPNQEETTIADCIQEYSFIYGIPDQILSDQGANFESNLVGEVCDLIDAKKVRTAPFNPHCNGGAERAIQTSTDMHAMFTNDDQDDWDIHSKKLEFAINTAVNRTTNYTPYELTYGHRPKIPIDIFVGALKPPEITDEVLKIGNVDLKFYDNYVNQMRDELKAVYQKVASNTEINMEKSKVIYDRKVRKCSFEVGDTVLCTNEQKAPRGKSKKLMTKWDGPYTILAKTDINYVLQSLNSKRIREVLINQLRLKTWGLPSVQTARFKTHKTRNRKSSKEILNTQPSQMTQDQYEPPKRRQPRVTPTTTAAMKVKRKYTKRKKVTETDTPQSHKQVPPPENQTANNNNTFGRRRKPPDRFVPNKN